MSVPPQISPLPPHFGRAPQPHRSAGIRTNHVRKKADGSGAVEPERKGKGY